MRCFKPEQTTVRLTTLSNNNSNLTNRDRVALSTAKPKVVY